MMIENVHRNLKLMKNFFPSQTISTMKKEAAMVIIIYLAFWGGFEANDILGVVVESRFEEMFKLLLLFENSPLRYETTLL